MIFTARDTLNLRFADKNADLAKVYVRSSSCILASIDGDLTNVVKSDD
jgi:hypothetical protein